MVGTRLIALLAVVLLALASAEAQTRKSWEGTISARSLNVRAGPGESYEIVAKLKRGDKVVAVDQSGRWVRLEGDAAAWVHRSFVRLPKDFMAPEFSAAENDFLDWAAETGDLTEIAVDGKGALALVLREDLYADAGAVETVARQIACGYRERVKVEGPVTVTVWAPGGPATGVAGRFSCP